MFSKQITLYLILYWLVQNTTTFYLEHGNYQKNYVYLSPASKFLLCNGNPDSLDLFNSKQICDINNSPNRNEYDKYESEKIGLILDAQNTNQKLYIGFFTKTPPLLVDGFLCIVSKLSYTTYYSFWNIFSPKVTEKKLVYVNVSPEECWTMIHEKRCKNGKKYVI